MKQDLWFASTAEQCHFKLINFPNHTVSSFCSLISPAVIPPFDSCNCVAFSLDYFLMIVSHYSSVFTCVLQKQTDFPSKLV